MVAANWCGCDVGSPRIDLIATWETPAIRYPLPLAQDAPHQPSLFPHHCLVILTSGTHWQRIGWNLY